MFREFAIYVSVQFQRFFEKWAEWIEFKQYMHLWKDVADVSSWMGGNRNGKRAFHE